MVQRLARWRIVPLGFDRLIGLGVIPMSGVNDAVTDQEWEYDMDT
jgi:hypothetical protein